MLASILWSANRILLRVRNSTESRDGLGAAVPNIQRDYLVLARAPTLKAQHGLLGVDIRSSMAVESVVGMSRDEAINAHPQNSG